MLRMPNPRARQARKHVSTQALQAWKHVSTQERRASDSAGLLIATKELFYYVYCF